MIETILEAFQFQFMIRALAVGVFVSLSAASLGSILVLKRYAMIGHGLAHVAFGAVAIGLLTQQQPLLIAMPIVVGVSLLILKVNDATDVHADASIGLAATVSMAIGTVLASVRGGFRVELNSYLFGSILTVQTLDLWLSGLFTVILLGFMALFYYDLFALTYDENYARVSGVRTLWLNRMIAVMTGIIVVLGIRLVGTILISSFIVFPTIIAMQFNRGFKTTMVVAMGLSLVTVIVGLLASYVYNTPSGSTIVLVHAVVFVMVYVSRRVLKLV